MRAHLDGCAMLRAEVRRRAQAAREAARTLLKCSRQLSDAADVLLREAEAALYALRDTMRQAPTRSATSGTSTQGPLDSRASGGDLRRGMSAGGSDALESAG